MIIANPIYDTVFKRMMENERVAKFFISTLLEEEIEAIEVLPQEFTYTDELRGLSVLRLDFIATIKTEIGEYKKVLIEIQKARDEIDLLRFRRYLGEQYKKKDKVNNEETTLPITTIYILGFTLPEIESACIRVERNYKDLINKTIIDKKSDFVEKLTHDCFVVQINRITKRYQTRLDKLLSVFEQDNFIGDLRSIKQFPYPADNEDLKILTDILQHTGASAEERKRIEDEEEAWRTFDAMFGKKLKKKEKELIEKKKELKKKDKEIAEKDKEIVEKDKEIVEKDKEIVEKDKEIVEKDKEIVEKDKALEEQVRQNAELLRQLEEMKRKLNEK